MKAVPKLVAKTLDDRQIDALLANPATENPLFLMVALEELRGYGSFENLNTLIARLPAHGRCPDDALRAGLRAPRERVRLEPGRARSSACSPVPGAASVVPSSWN